MKIFKKLSITFINASISASMLGLATPVHASTSNGFPNRPITIVVPYPAGGGSDSVERIVARKLNERLGQPIVVDNVDGASSLIDRKSVVMGKSVAVRVDLGGRRHIKKQNHRQHYPKKSRATCKEIMRE